MLLRRRILQLWSRSSNLPEQTRLVAPSSPRHSHHKCPRPATAVTANLRPSSSSAPSWSSSAASRKHSLPLKHLRPPKLPGTLPRQGSVLWKFVTSGSLSLWALCLCLSGPVSCRKRAALEPCSDTPRIIMDTTGSISASEALRHLGQDSCPLSLTRGLLKKPKCMHSRRSGASRHREAILRGVAAGRFYPVLAAAERAALCSDAALTQL